MCICIIGLDKIPVPQINDIKRITSINNIPGVLDRLRNNNVQMSKLNELTLLYIYELGTIYNTLSNIWINRDKKQYKETKFIDFLKVHEKGITTTPISVHSLNNINKHCRVILYIYIYIYI